MLELLNFKFLKIFSFYFRDIQYIPLYFKTQCLPKHQRNTFSFPKIKCSQLLIRRLISWELGFLLILAQLLCLSRWARCNWHLSIPCSRVDHKETFLFYSINQNIQYTFYFSFSQWDNYKQASIKKQIPQLTCFPSLVSCREMSVNTSIEINRLL